MTALKSHGVLMPKHIIKIESCQHDINHPEANGNFWKYICRTIQVLIKDQAATQ